MKRVLAFAAAAWSVPHFQREAGPPALLQLAASGEGEAAELARAASDVEVVVNPEPNVKCGPNQMGTCESQEEKECPAKNVDISELFPEHCDENEDKKLCCVKEKIWNLYNSPTIKVNSHEWRLLGGRLAWKFDKAFKFSTNGEVIDIEGIKGITDTIRMPNADFGAAGLDLHITGIKGGMSHKKSQVLAKKMFGDQLAVSPAVLIECRGCATMTTPKLIAISGRTEEPTEAQKATIALLRGQLAGGKIVDASVDSRVPITDEATAAFVTLVKLFFGLP